MKNDTLKIEKRQEVGGGKARRLLTHGAVPAVVYGKGMESSPAQVRSNELRNFLKNHGRNSVFNTEFAEEQNFSVLLKDVQLDPVNKEIVHLDFQKINSNEKVQVEVPIRIIGRDQAEKHGSVVVHQLDSIKVECLPGDIPQHVDADISGLKPGNSFTAGNIPLPGSVTMLSKPSEIILTVNGHDQAAAPEA